MRPSRARGGLTPWPHVCTRTTSTTSAPGLRSPPPHLHRDWAHPRHICGWTGLTPPTSAPRPRPPPPHLRRNCAGDFPPDTLEKAYAKVKSRAAMPRRLRTARRIRVATVSVLQPIYMARLRIGYRYHDRHAHYHYGYSHYHCRHSHHALRLFALFTTAIRIMHYGRSSPRKCRSSSGSTSAFRSAPTVCRGSSAKSRWAHPAAHVSTATWAHPAAHIRTATECRMASTCKARRARGF